MQIGMIGDATVNHCHTDPRSVQSKLPGDVGADCCGGVVVGALHLAIGGNVDNIWIVREPRECAGRQRIQTGLYRLQVPQECSAHVANVLMIGVRGDVCELHDDIHRRCGIYGLQVIGYLFWPCEGTAGRQQNEECQPYQPCPPGRTL